MKKADYLPCFTCSLPDCDDTSIRCGLRRAEAQYRQLKKDGLPIPEDVRLRYAAAHQERYGQFRRKGQGEIKQ